VLRRTRSSHPWALTTRHPWRVTVRRNTPPPPPDGAYPPCIETRCLAPLVRCASIRLARFSGTDALRVVTWMGRPSTEHCRLDVAPRTKSHDRIHSGGGGSVRRTITRHGWRVVSAHGWLERVRRTEPPSPVHHPKAPREVPRRRATRQTHTNAIDSADTGHKQSADGQALLSVERSR